MAIGHSICAVCGKQFKSHNPTPTFCSRVCKDKCQEAVFDIESAITMYRSGATQVEVAEHFGVTQKTIWGVFRRRGVKARRQVKRNQRGENNASWKGDAAGYQALHKRVQNLRGTPNKCELCGTTTAKYFDWANLTKNYADPQDYKRMCRSCHLKHDRVIRNNLQSAKGGDAACPASNLL